LRTPAKYKPLMFAGFCARGMLQRSVACHVSSRRTYFAIAAFLSAQGAPRRVLLGRGVLFVLVPTVAPMAIGLVQNGTALLFASASAPPYDAVSRTREVVDDWIMITYSGLGIFFAYVG
jgi:hypothetical protein